MPSARRLPSGQWQGVARRPDGRRATRTWPLKRQALHWAQATEAEWRRSGFRDPRSGQVTVAEWHERWRAARLAGRKTMRRNEQVWRLYVEPRWATWPLEAITRMEVQGWAAGLLADGTGTRTVQQAVGLLSMLLQAALEEDPPILAGRNPCRGVVASLPESPQRPPTWFTHEQAAAIIRELPEPLTTAADLACWVGLRWGELAGLQTRHVDQLHGLIHVQTVLEWDGRLREHPKSKMSRRTVPIPVHLRDRLAELAAADGFVFRRNGKPLPYDWARSRWDHAVTAARTCEPGAPCRRGGACLDAGHRVPQYSWHSTRHTAASWLVQAGVDLYRVQQLMGHESHVTTRRYAHLAPDAHDVVRGAWGRMDSGARTAHVGPETGSAGTPEG